MRRHDAGVELSSPANSRATAAGARRRRGRASCHRSHRGGGADDATVRVPLGGAPPISRGAHAVRPRSRRRSIAGEALGQHARYLERGVRRADREEELGFGRRVPRACPRRGRRPRAPGSRRFVPRMPRAPRGRFALGSGADAPRPSRRAQSPTITARRRARRRRRRRITPFIVKNAASRRRRSPGRTSVCS